MNIINLKNFNHWQLTNAQKVGFKNIPLNTKITVDFIRIEKMFGPDITSRMVNPLSGDDDLPMGVILYEWLAETRRNKWLAETRCNIEDKCKELLYAMRHFSWQYPQLKMICHKVKLTSPDPRTEFFLDNDYFLNNMEFVLEFLS